MLLIYIYMTSVKRVQFSGSAVGTKEEVGERDCAITS